MEKHELIIIYYDESFFNTNEGQSWMWGTGEEPCLQTKTIGTGIKMSDQHSGTLQLSNQEHSLAFVAELTFPKS